MQNSFVQEYINMRNSKGYDLNLFWRMYKSEGGVLKNPQEFMKHFLYEVQNVEGMEFRHTRDKETILNGIDTKLGITILYSNTGQFIKVVA